MLPNLRTIKKKRKLLDLTQKQLAEFSGVSQSLIAKIESNKIDPTYSKVKSIFEALKSLDNEDKKANELMTKKIISVRSDQSIKHTIKLMKINSISQLPVIENNHQIGSITERDILNNLDKNVVKEIMQDPFPSIPKNSTSFISLLREFQAVIVVHKKNIVGIITRSDVI